MDELKDMIENDTFKKKISVIILLPCEKRFEGDLEFGICLNYAVDCFEPIF